MAHQAAAEDKRFVGEFEAFGIPPDEFTHRAHIRLAYTYLCEHDTQAAHSMVRRALCGFLAHIGADPASKYHETMTLAWVLAVRHFMARTPDTRSATEFIAASPKLLDSGILRTHYSDGVLFSPAARRAFVEPDRLPIPRYGAGATSPGQSSSRSAKLASQTGGLVSSGPPVSLVIRGLATRQPVRLPLGSGVMEPA